MLQGDEIGFDDHGAAQGVAEQAVLVARFGAPALDDDAGAGFDERAVALFLEGREEGGERHVQRVGEACRLASEGEIWPFSIFDSMPPDNPAEAASSETVMPMRRRNWRT